jgi:hypothetical protein
MLGMTELHLWAAAWYLSAYLTFMALAYVDGKLHVYDLFWFAVWSVAGPLAPLGWVIGYIAINWETVIWRRSQ